MLRFAVLAFLTVVMGVPAAHGAYRAAGADAVVAKGRQMYIVSLAAEPLASFAGSDAVRDSKGVRLKATSTAMTGARQLDVSTDASKAYLEFLGAEHRAVLGEFGVKAKRAMVPRFDYRVVANGMALELSADEAEILRGMPGVTAVRIERHFQLLTDAGPTWIGANQLWNGVVPGSNARTQGEGVLIGVIDSGVNATHPSFADIGGDGYNHSNPAGHLFGLCLTTPARCNDKLVGIYDFGTEGARDGSDIDGHGSHTTSTAGGNAISAAVTGTGYSVPLQLAGVAPHANLISYKACEAVADGTSCAESQLLAAINQATIDHVAVINYSIGGNADDPWATVRGAGNDQAKAMLNARAAGVFLSVAAGNSGPSASTIDSPGNAPWVVAAAAATHNRRFANTLSGVSGAGIATPLNFRGVGLTGALPNARIVHAKDFGNALCGTGPTEATPTGASNPFPLGTFHGEIVICVRGTYGRVEKGFNVKLAGAGGYVLVNTTVEAESTVADSHLLPAVHLGYALGQQLQQVVENARLAGGQVSGAITGLARILDDSSADVLAGFSSRGPVTPDGGWLKPNITAPGVNILAAGKSGSAIASLSGTSMAAPHIAGAVALLVAAHPQWTVAQLESALLTTTLDGVRNEDGVTLSDPHQDGGGRAFVPAAVRAGLFFNVTREAFVAADPNFGAGGPAALNMPYLVDDSCTQHCSFTRRATDMAGGGSWRAELRLPTGGTGTVTPSTFTLGNAQTATLTIDVNVGDGLLSGAWVYGELALIPTSSANLPEQRLPIAVFSDPGAVPAMVDIVAHTSNGFVDRGLSGIAALGDASFAATPLVRSDVDRRTLPQDSNRNDPFSATGTGRIVKTLTLSAPASGAATYALAVDLNSATSRDLDLYVGEDLDGDGPEASELTCLSASAAVRESCILDVTLAAGSARTFWVSAVNFSSSVAGTDAIDLAIARVPLSGSASAGTPGTLVTTGPGHTALNENFDLRHAWSVPSMLPGDRWTGLSNFTANRLRPGQVGRSLVNIDAASDMVQSPQVLDARNQTLALRLLPGAAHARIVVDIPPNASSFVADTAGTGNVDLYVARSPTPVTGPDFADAPPRGQAQATSIHDGATEQVVVSGATLTPGRWYITPVNAGSTTAEFNLHVQTTATSAAPTLRDNAYYNPARSGHGVFFNAGGDQWVVFWYAYLQDGTPMWYLAQATRPGANEAVWHAPLYRFTWNGSQNQGTVVGSVILTRTGFDQFNWTWQLDGTWGSEPMVAVSPPACPTVAGVAQDFSGAWFAPVLSGYGFSVLTYASTEVEVAYLYDGRGAPRWLYAQNSPFGSGSFSFTQYRGFCPLCAFQNIQGQAGGTMTRTFATVRDGTATVNATFVAPVPGTWTTNHSTTKLTQDLSCQ